MAKIYKNIEELIGKTPLLELTHLEEIHNLDAKVLAKVEFLNPGGSAKDRVAKKMVEDAEAKGLLKAGATIIEPTSGNTGIGLAVMAAARGYRAIIVMPDSMSMERRLLMSAFGAELVLTEGAKGMAGAIAKAEEVDIFVAGIGTGGTITGVGRYLREKNPDVQIIGVEPASSPLLTEGRAGSHGLQGIGANFVPSILDTKLYNEIITVTEEAAYAAGREVAQKEGLLVGISAGAAIHAALEVAKRPENKGKNIVVLLPDTGDRYLSTPMFQA